MLIESDTHYPSNYSSPSKIALVNCDVGFRVPRYANRLPGLGFCCRIANVSPSTKRDFIDLELANLQCHSRVDNLEHLANAAFTGNEIYSFFVHTTSCGGCSSSTDFQSPR
ncbi:hypothetical protein TNCV_2747431 [Trichonephila clavipes]|nr:hypothetical protein TNCV_2747431 [Trichonephila clavipes]